MDITTADKILVAALIILNGWLFTNWGTGFSKGNWVVVTVNQKETIRLPLDQDQATHVEGPLGLTEIEVKKGGLASFVHHAKIKYALSLETSVTLIDLPHVFPTVSWYESSAKTIVASTPS